MKSNSKTSAAVLAILPAQEDRLFIHDICDRNNWRFQLAQTYEEAKRALHGSPLGVVIVESRLPCGHCWQDLFQLTQTIVVPPPLIVTDRFADERLWAEVLNLGGYDVLMKPFDAIEVIRVVNLAWLSWRQHNEVSSRRPLAKALIDRSRAS